MLVYPIRFKPTMHPYKSTARPNLGPLATISRDALLYDKSVNSD
jgi:hypothetical protein